MRLPWRINKQDQDDEPIGLDQDRIRLERVGHSRIDEAVSSVRRTPWSLTLLQLLWTAGPVTFLAMQGGYFLGFGHAAPAQNFIFFAAYTLILGVIGLVARFVAIMLRGRHQKDAREVLSKTIDLLPDLLFHCRDQVLMELNPEARRLRAAGALLHELDLSSASVALAVRELTSDSSLAEITEQIEIYRRLGLRSRVQDLVEASAEARAAALEKVHEVAPEEADLLRQRLMGVAPSFENGVPRRENFLTTIFSAADQHKLDLMALEDVQELLVLMFELFSGRQITQLVIDYEGNWEIVRSLEEVEHTRSRYNVSQAMALSRMYALADKLSEHSELGFEEPLTGLSSEQLLTHLTRGLEQLVHGYSIDAPSKQYLRSLLELVRETRRTGEDLQKRRNRYARALERWEDLRQRKPLRERSFRLTRSSRGLRISEEKIALEDDQKIELAQKFCESLRELGFKPGAQGVERNGRTINSEDLKRLAIRLCLILDSCVPISDAGIQRAIYSSRAAYIGGLEIGFSADAKAGLGAAAVSEVQEDMGKAAEHLALRIHRVYHLPLSASMIDFLVEQYNANRDRLTIIAESPLDETPYSSQFTAIMLRLTMDSQRWRQIILQLEQLIEKYDRRGSAR